VTAGPPSTPRDYDTLRESLLEAGALLALPELHGGVSGALCAGGPVAAERWLDGLFAANEAADLTTLRDSLRDLVQATWRTLGGGELGFEPLLPEEDAPLEDQVQALALWCHGFLNGLGTIAPELTPRGVTAAGVDGATAREVAEILADFAEISRAGVGEDDAADRDQAGFALAEIKEYARVSAQIVFEDLAQLRASAAREAH
jgi:uncharacterized protein YgfB (UPF0149 family)